MLETTVPWDVETHCWDDLVDDDLRTIYDAYARVLGIGSRPAVLAIDLYQLVFAGGALPPEALQDSHPSSCGRYAHAALDPIGHVFGIGRSLGLPILHATVSRERTGRSATNRRGLPIDSDAWDFHPACAPQPGETIVAKARASAFYGTPLVSELIRLGVDTVVVVGETTSGCVRASVVDAYSNGFHVVVVEDAVFDRSWLSHRVSLFDLHHKYADVMSSHTVSGLLASSQAVSAR